MTSDQNLWEFRRIDPIALEDAFDNIYVQNGYLRHVCFGISIYLACLGSLNFKISTIMSLILALLYYTSNLWETYAEKFFININNSYAPNDYNNFLSIFQCIETYEGLLRYSVYNIYSWIITIAFCIIIIITSSIILSVSQKNRFTGSVFIIAGLLSPSALIFKSLELMELPKNDTIIYAGAYIVLALVFPLIHIPAYIMGFSLQGTFSALILAALIFNPSFMRGKSEFPLTRKFKMDMSENKIRYIFLGILIASLIVNSVFFFVRRKLRSQKKPSEEAEVWNPRN